MNNFSKWFLELYKNIFSNEQEFETFLNNCHHPLKKSIKICYNKIDPIKFIEQIKKFWRELTNNWIEESSNNFKDVYFIDRENTSLALWKTFFHLSWFFYIQETSASIPPKFLDLWKDELVLDMCSSPWWKSIQIWDYLQRNCHENTWFVICNEISKKRILPLAHNLNRTWIYNSWIINFNWFSLWKSLFELFDKVLVDAPCSGEWIWFKSDFWMKIRKIEEIKRIAGTQFQLLISWFKALKKWWTLVFSTCTMNPYENELNVEKILNFFWNDIELVDIQISNKNCWISNHNNLSQENLKKLCRFWPHKNNSWWFFISKFIKKNSFETINKIHKNNLFPKNPFKLDISKWLQEKVFSYMTKNFWINIKNNWFLFLLINNQVYLTSKKFLEIKDKIEFEKIWVTILKKLNDEFIPNNNFWTIFWKYATKNFCELEFEDMQNYANWNDVQTEKIIDWIYDKWFVILKYKWYWMWIWKIIDNFIKNKYIRI